MPCGLILPFPTGLREQLENMVLSRGMKCYIATEPQIDIFSSLRMKLKQKEPGQIFDLHLGLTFDWRETGILRWRILLWMLFFGVCLSVAAVFVDVDVPGVRRRANQTAAVILFPADNPACISMCSAILLCL